MPDIKTADSILHSGAMPDVQALSLDFERTGGFFNYATRSASSDNSRFMVWAGQSEDGKKWTKKIGVDAFPWDGANDARIPLVDGIVQDLKTADGIALSRAQLKVVATNAADTGKAGSAQKLMEWVMQCLKDEIEEEGELLSDYRHSRGIGAIQVMWDTEVAVKRKKVTMQDVMQIAQQNPRLALLPQLVLDPALEDQAVLTAQQLLDLEPAPARKLVRALRNEGAGEYPERYTARNLPSFTARRWGDDWFCPVEMTDPQWSRAHYFREFLGEAELRDRVATEDWSEATVNDWLKNAKGQTSAWELNASPLNSRDGIFTPYMPVDMRSEMVEVLHALVKQVNEDGLAEIYCTVFCPHRIKGEGGKELYAVHYPLGFDHAKYPLAVCSRERLSRRPIDSRGVGEIASTWQAEVKAQSDMLVDRTNLEINPPLLVPSNRGQKYQIGPGNQVSRLMRDEIDFMKPPAGNPALAFQVIEMVERRTANYFGTMHKDIPPAKWQAYMQKSVNGYLRTWKEALRQAFQLCQQFLTDEDFQRISGGREGFPKSAEDIAGQFDFQLVFDARDLDMEFTFKKLDAISKLAVPLDKGGVIDYAKLAALAVASIDSSMAGVVISESAGAARKVFEDVNKSIALMALGNEAEYVENDPTAPMKLQFAQQIVGANPKYQQGLQQDERFRDLMENFTKNLNQSAVQMGQNVVTGRTGVKPVGS